VTPAGPKGHPAARFRWLVLAVFVLSSAINYLDRQSLATLAPLVRAEFHLSNTQYGLILTPSPSPTWPARRSPAC
jgi:sugar phosphate permease